MVKLINILKEVLKELADTNKTFSFHKSGDDVKEIEDSEYLKGSIYYNFETESKLEYEVQISYLPDYDEIYDYVHDEQEQMIEVNFYVNNGSGESVFSLTNNQKELFRVMSTIVSCLKDALKEHPFKYIVYHPSDHKNSGRDAKGAKQRTKLYNYYIKKEFPNSEMSKKGPYEFVKLQ